MTNESNSPPPSDATTAPSSPLPVSGLKTPRQIASATLLQGEREVQIVHGEEIYRLSLTRQGKLILHK